MDCMKLNNVFFYTCTNFSLHANMTCSGNTSTQYNWMRYMQRQKRLGFFGTMFGVGLNED